MAHETLWASVTIYFIWTATAVICMPAPDLVIEGMGRVPIAAVISPVCAAFATKYVMGWVKRS